MKIQIAILASALLAGCATPEMLVKKNSYDLCYMAYGNRPGGFSFGDIWGELHKRNEDCGKYRDMVNMRIEARDREQQSSGIPNNAQTQLGLQLLQMAQPKPFTPQSSNSMHCRTRWINNVAYTDCD